jgi:ATP citrate (pro-S)-lyase
VWRGVWLQANPQVKMLVMLGEVGGLDEYAVVAALKDKRITKPLVAWCIGTCAKVRPPLCWRLVAASV